MPKTIAITYRFPAILNQAIEEAAKEMQISKVAVIELALLEFLFKRDQVISRKLIYRYKQFVSSLKN